MLPSPYSVPIIAKRRKYSERETIEPSQISHGDGGEDEPAYNLISPVRKFLLLTDVRKLSFVGSEGKPKLSNNARILIFSNDAKKSGII